MGKGILIITNSCDLHADILSTKLEDSGINNFRLNLDHFPRDYIFGQNYNNSSWSQSLLHLPTGKKIELSNVGSTWLRKKADFSFIDNNLDAQELAFAKDQTDHSLFGLMYSLKDCYWMNHPAATRQAMFKGEQLKRASRMGFHIPKTLITNDPKAVINFKRSVPGDIIFKAMSSPFLAVDKAKPDEQKYHGLPTTLVTDEHMEYIDSVSQVPCCFQEYIPKKYELRVTVIGYKIFAAKINSQDDIRTQIDLRDFSADIKYSSTQLPKELKQLCIDYIHSYGLTYGAIDIIVTPENEYVFLENNPNGQFWYVEQLVPELNMMDSLADNLISGMHR